MKNHAIITFVYSALLLLGGLIGYLKAGSIVSLAMSSTFAVLLILCAFAMLRGLVTGYFGSAALSLILTLFFSVRFLMSYRFMPAGFMFIISLATFLALIFLKRNRAE